MIGGELEVHSQIFSRFHSTLSARSFISCACPVALSNLDWKSAPPCSQATLMAAFLSLATTINFDGLSSLLLRNVTTYVFATAGENRDQAMQVVEQDINKA